MSQSAIAMIVMLFTLSLPAHAANKMTEYKLALSACTITFKAWGNGKVKVDGTDPSVGVYSRSNFKKNRLTLDLTVFFSCTARNVQSLCSELDYQFEEGHWSSKSDAFTDEMKPWTKPTLTELTSGPLQGAVTSSLLTGVSYSARLANFCIGNDNLTISGYTESIGNNKTDVLRDFIAVIKSVKATGKTGD